MKKIKWLSFLLFILLLVSITSPVLAQDYSFQVLKENVDVYINSDGSATIEYAYLFKNNSGAHDIDFVDIGLPNSNYSLSNITASIDGKTINDIQASPYVSPGIALGLGGNTLRPGQSGTLVVRIAGIQKMLYVDKQHNGQDYAGFQFSPNNFDASFVTGTTELTVTLHLPSGLQPEEPLFANPKNWPGTSEPSSAFDNENRVIYQWSSPSASAGEKYIFGASFPARMVPKETINTQQSITFIPSDVFATLVPILCCVGVILLIIVIIVIAVKSTNKRKLQYLPPKIAVEGHGIKRGLTPVEVAILMEQSMDKILTMVLFSVLKKEAATVINRDPLDIKVEEKLPEGLQPYETNFLTAFRKADQTERRKALQDMMISLVQSISEKMKGFSRKETIDYYQSIMKQAWQQVEAAGTPEVKSEKYSENMDWTMLDKDYDERTRRTFGTGPVWMPWWWWRADPTISRPSAGLPRTSGAPSMPSGGKSTTINLPRLPGADAAASVVGTVQAFSSKVVGNLNSFTSAVTNKTNPLPQPTSSGWKPSGGSGGGGSHCVCACACACVSCACACAGGGR